MRALITTLRLCLGSFLIASYFINSVFSDKDLRRGVWNGHEMKVLAYNVSVLLSSCFILIHEQLLKFSAAKFPPMFTYKKEKDGNYTVGGMAKDLMDDGKDYMNIRCVRTLATRKFTNESLY